MASTMIAADPQRRPRHRLSAVVVWLLAAGAALLAGVVAAPVASADGGPTTCKLGAYLVSLSKVDTAARSFAPTPTTSFPLVSSGHRHR